MSVRWFAFLSILAWSLMAQAQAVDVEVEFARAAYAYHGADFDTALTLLQSARQRDPRHLPTLHLLGVLLIQRGNLDLGVGALQEALTQQEALAHGGAARFSQIHYELGLGLFRMGRFQEAAAALEEAARAEPARAGPAYLLGMSFYELHDYARAAELFKRAAELAPKGDLLRTAATFYRGEAMLRAGDAISAQRAFATVRRDGPTTVFADIAAKGGTMQGESGGGGAYAYLGAQFDSNVALATSDATLGVSPPTATTQLKGAAPAGARGVLDAGVRYTTPIAGPVDFGAGLFFYQNYHLTNTAVTEAFNLTSGGAEAELGVRFSEKPIQDRLALGYRGDVDFVHGDPALVGASTFNFYSARHHPYAAFELREGRSWYTSARYTLALEQFRDTTVGITDPRDRRGFVGHAARLGQHYLFPRKWGRASAGLLFESDDAVGQRWDRVAVGGFVSGEVTFFTRLSVRADLQLIYLRYANDDRAPDRGDRNLIARGDVQYWFVDNFGLNAHVRYEKNASPLAAFDYDRLVAGGALMARY